MFIIEYLVGAILAGNKQFTYNWMIFDTRVDLSLLVRQNKFDEELYFRITRNKLELPSLAVRNGDARAIVDNTFDRLKMKYEKTKLKVDSQVLQMMYAYSWPSNIHEIEKTVDLLVCNAKTDTITIEDIKEQPFASASNCSIRTIDELERDMIAKKLVESKNKDHIAKTMGISRATLYRKIKKFGLQ